MAQHFIEEGQRRQEEFHKEQVAAGNGTRQHPPRVRTVEEERNEAARELENVEASFSHETTAPVLGAPAGSFDSGGMVLIQFPFSTQPTRIAARNWPGAKACGAKLVSEEPAPVHMQETVNGHVGPRIHVL